MYRAPGRAAQAGSSGGPCPDRAVYLDLPCARACSAPAGKMKVMIRARVDTPIHAQIVGIPRSRPDQATSTKDGGVRFLMTPTHGEWREFEVQFQATKPLMGLRMGTGGTGSRLDIDSIVLRTMPE